MKLFKKKNFWLGLLGLVLMLGGMYIAWTILAFFFRKLSEVNATFAASLIGAMATILAGITAVLITQRQTKLREIDETHRPQKVEIYKKFLQTVTSMLAGQNENVSIKGPSQQELIDYLVGFKTELLLWGSPNVIKAQLNFQKEAENNGDVFEAVNILYKAIREDIGLSNKGLNNFELIKLFLKNPDEIDIFRASNKTIKTEN